MRQLRTEPPAPSFLARAWTPHCFCLGLYNMVNADADAKVREQLHPQKVSDKKFRQ
jgi:hypothetical protein